MGVSTGANCMPLLVTSRIYSQPLLAYSKKGLNEPSRLPWVATRAGRREKPGG